MQSRAVSARSGRTSEIRKHVRTSTSIIALKDGYSVIVTTSIGRSEHDA